MVRTPRLAVRPSVRSILFALAIFLLPLPWQMSREAALAAPPTITNQPRDTAACNGDGAGFYFSATGTQPLAYQWRRGTTNLSDGGNIAGATTSQLGIRPATFSDAATDYNCVVSNAQGAATTRNATLNIFATGTGDTNGDGIIDGRDVQGFIGALLCYACPPTASFCAADMTGDFHVDCDDLCFFVQVLLSSPLGCGLPPENDDCPNAFVVTTGIVYDGSTTFATRDGPHITCESGCAPVCNTAPDVWYRWAADFDGPADFLMCDMPTGYDAIMAVYDACPTLGGVQLACNDDGCTNVYVSRIVSLSVTTGQTYWICISGWKGAKGCFTFRVVPYSGP